MPLAGLSTPPRGGEGREKYVSEAAMALLRNVARRTAQGQTGAAVPECCLTHPSTRAPSPVVLCRQLRRGRGDMIANRTLPSRLGSAPTRWSRPRSHAVSPLENSTCKQVHGVIAFTGQKTPMDSRSHNGSGLHARSLNGELDISGVLLLSMDPLTSWMA